MNTYKDTLRLVKGNDFATVHDIVAKYPDDTVVEGFDLNLCTDLTVRIKRGSISSFNDIATYAENWSIIEPKKIKIKFDGLKMKNGSYRVEFFGKFQGKDWRSYSKNEGFDIVESNEEANIPVGSFIADGVYQIKTDFLMTYQTQEQSDWDETDTSSPSYIKNKPELFSGVYDDLENKPDLSVYVEKVDGKGLSENDYTDEDKQKVVNAVTRTVADLANYYLKSETYTQNEVNELIASIENFHYEIYPNISYIASPLSNVLYLIGPVGSGSDRYEEYVYYNDTFVKIGDTSIDLSGYVTSFELSEALTGYVLQSSLASILSDYQEKLFSGINIKTINEQSILGDGNIEIQSGEDNVIEVVKVNNVTLTPDAEKAVNVSVPAALSQLNEDTTHRTVSDTEKSTWNGKYSKPNDGIPSTDLASGVIPDVSNFITKSVNDLVNYYTKSQTYTQAEVQQLINAVKQFTYESVSTLPTASSSTMNKIYLVPSSDPQTQNVKDEYITIESSGTYSWELIGNTSVDLSGYVTTTDLNTALASYTTTADLNTLLAGYQTKIDSNHKLDYSLLSNTPTIPDAQIQSDWEQTVTTAKDYIKNKPTIPAAQVNSDWNASSGVAQILNKPTIPTITFRQW